MNRRLLVVSVFGRIDEESNDRVNSIHDFFECEVKIVTTDFSHRHKKNHDKSTFRNVDFLHVTKYKNNISLKRLFSHWLFAFKLLFYLNKNAKYYDAILCLIPTPSSALACYFYNILHGKKKKVFIDVIDLWPEGMINLSNRILHFLLRPWKWFSQYIYRRADKIFTATEAYQLFCKKSNNKIGGCYPLGVAKVKFSDRLPQNYSKPAGDIWVGYAGNISQGYDFSRIVQALKYIQSFYSNVKFILIGSGDMEEKIKSQLRNNKIDFIATGFLKYTDYLSWLSFCDIGFNIYKDGTHVKQSYKFNDYVLTNTFIINNLTGETAAIINKFKVGLNISSNSNLSSVLLSSIKIIKTENNALLDRFDILKGEELDKQKIYNNYEMELWSAV